MNDEYEQTQSQNEDIISSLQSLIRKYPYKILSFKGFSNVNEESIDDDEDDFSICEFPEHRQFVIGVREAEKLAKQQGERAFYEWRGYRGFVAHNLPRITLPGLRMRLMNAMQRIPDLSPPEKAVKKRKKVLTLY